jgi:hypothetical protein
MSTGKKNVLLSDDRFGAKEKVVYVVRKNPIDDSNTI